MFDNDPRDLAATLTAMHRQAIERCRYDQNEAKETMKAYVASDRRFDQFDADALVNRVAECRSNGAVLDLDDPRLKGLEPRPLEKSYW